MHISYIFFFLSADPGLRQGRGSAWDHRFKHYICSLQMPQCFAAASPQAFVVRALKPAVCLHGPLFLGRSSLPFAASRQTLKILRGSFDQALWPQAFVLGALQPAVCLHGPLFLGRSSLPFASRQRLKILGGSFDQALWPQAVVLGALQPAVAASTRNSGHRPLFLQPCSLPFALMALCSWGVQACR